MTFAVFRAALLSLLADRGALAMAFVVPVIFFLVLGAIFASSTGGDLQLRLAVADEVQSPESRALIAALERDPGLTRLPGNLDRATARDLVRRGTADVGLVVRADGEPLDDVQGLAAPPLLLLVDPSRAVAGQILTGQLQRAWFTALPDLALGQAVDVIGNQIIEFTPDQEADLARTLPNLRPGPENETGTAPLPGWRFDDLLEQENVAGQNAARNNVAYYAGAVAFMFLLLVAAQTALGLWDDRESGVLDRILAGPGGLAVALNGRFLWLVVQGLVQTAVIFTAAWLVYGVDLPGNFGPWLLVASAGAVSAAGIGLALVLACRSRAQAQVLPAVVILILSALGGSMVPRFFMPPWLQDLGWMTPNTWALEAWIGVFWRGDPALSLLPLCAIMLGTGLAGLAAAHLLGRGLAKS